jgi:hypothetical protein
VNELENKRIKKQNKVVKATLALLVAGTAFSATNVLAEEPMAPIEVELQIEGSAESNELAETKNDQLLESPSLVPGDFFYFTKVLLEKIELALTFDDIKEARLIAEYAAERLAEAEVLFAEGDEKAALETMTAAIEYMENADDVIVEPVTEESTEEQTDVIDEVLEVEVIDNDDASSKEETEVEEGEIEALVSQNIIALTAALDKVKNPKAKAALQKNIDKSYTKLAKKIEKQIKKEEKQTKKAEEIIKKESAIIEPVEVVEEEAGTEVITDEVQPSPVTPTKHEQRDALKIEKKNIQKEAKQQRNEAKAQVMDEKKQHKENKKEAKGNNGGKGNNGKGN